jgi:hypothetical protein
MGRYERNVYFEKLVSLKLRSWGDDDRRGVISIEDVVVYAEAVMLATEIEHHRIDAGAVADPAPDAAPAATTATATSTTSASELDVPTWTATDPSARSRRLLDGWFGPARGATPAPDEGA